MHIATERLNLQVIKKQSKKFEYLIHSTWYLQSLNRQQLIAPIKRISFSYFRIVSHVCVIVCAWWL